MLDYRPRRLSGVAAWWQRDPYKAVDAQVGLPSPAAEEGGLLEQVEYLSRKLWVVPPAQVGRERGSALWNLTRFGLFRKS